MKPVHEMSSAELIDEAERREANRRVGRPLDYVATPDGIESPDQETMREKREAAHQLECRKLMRAFGFEVVSFSQPRKSKQTPGIPDTKYYHRERHLTLWHEDKAEWGRQSPAQKKFQEMAEACGEIYVLGPLHMLHAWLLDTRIAAREGALLVPLPYEEQTV